MSTEKDAHWMEDAERIYPGEPGSYGYLGECDHGDLWVPGRNPDCHWGGCAQHPTPWRQFNRWNPRHLRVYWRSRRRGRVIWLERATTHGGSHA